MSSGVEPDAVRDILRGDPERLLARHRHAVEHRLAGACAKHVGAVDAGRALLRRREDSELRRELPGGNLLRDAATSHREREVPPLALEVWRAEPVSAVDALDDYDVRALKVGMDGDGVVARRDALRLRRDLSVGIDAKRHPRPVAPPLAPRPRRLHHLRREADDGIKRLRPAAEPVRLRRRRLHPNGAKLRPRRNGDEHAAQRNHAECRYRSVAHDGLPHDHHQSPWCGIDAVFPYEQLAACLD